MSKYGLEKEIEKVINAEISDETYPEILSGIRTRLGSDKLDILV